MDEIQDDENSELRVPKGSKRYHTTEADLADLERILPEVFEWLVHEVAYKGGPAEDRGPELRTKFRRVQKIITDIRWNYGPHESIGRVPCGPESDDQ